MTTKVWLVVTVMILQGELIYFSNCEVFSSMANMEHLVKYEQQLLKAIEKFIKTNEIILKSLKTFMKEANTLHQFINETGISEYLKNPVNVYRTIRRINIQWNSLHETFDTDQIWSEDFVREFENNKKFRPNDEDRTGAIEALLRLQHTYQIPSNILAKGIIPGSPHLTSEPLKLEEMYEIGRLAYDVENFYYSGMWMKEALGTMADEPGDHKSIDKSKLLEDLAFSEFQNGDTLEAVHVTQKLLKLRPNDEHIKEKLKFYTNVHIKKENLPTGLREQIEMIQKKKKDGMAHLQTYNSLCRGEVIRKLSKVEEQTMKCWYKKNDPVLRLKPQKTEQIWTKPDIFRFYDILTDHQVEMIKESSYPTLARSNVRYTSGEKSVIKERIGKTSNIFQKDNKFLRSIAIRAEAVIGLNVTVSTESLSVTNYGIGGHFNVHTDHVNDENGDMFSEFGMGNRLATLMFYLSDVEAGGATAFLYGQTAVFPNKRDGIFWYNLKRNGKGDISTAHGGCPVLAGQKWIGNWWVHEHGQEFKRPCALDRDL